MICPDEDCRHGSTYGSRANVPPPMVVVAVTSSCALSAAGVMDNGADLARASSEGGREHQSHSDGPWKLEFRG